MRRNRDARDDREREAAQALAAQFEGRTIAVKARAGAEGRLFGSITTVDIAEAVLKQTGAELDRRKIELAEPLKELGGVDLPVRLHPDVVANLHVEVEARGLTTAGFHSRPQRFSTRLWTIVGRGGSA